MWPPGAPGFAPKARLLQRLLAQPWAPAALAAAALAPLLLRLLRAAPLHFADARVEARYIAWIACRHACRDVAVHLVWLAAAAAYCVKARTAAPPSGAAAALAPLALLGPSVPAALAAALRGRWYARHREAVIVANRLVQALAALVLHAAGPPLPTPGAWQQALLAQAASALLTRVRLSAFLPAQLAHVLASACAGGACVARVGGGAESGAAAALHLWRLGGFGFCLPSLLVFGIEAYSRRSFVRLAWGCGEAAAPLPHGTGAMH